MNILMVCTANICRSPMAHIVAVHIAQQTSLSRQVHIASAGTHASKGSPNPDRRATLALENRGYRVKKGCARKIDPKDFARFDLILAMDRPNLSALQAGCPPEHRHKLHLFLQQLKNGDRETEEVPDPYYGNAEGFERVLDLCEAGVKSWFAHLASTHPSSVK